MLKLTNNAFSFGIGPLYVINANQRATAGRHYMHTIRATSSD